MTNTELLTPQALLTHWQGHRALTRRTIDAFPDDRLFAFRMGGMRSFGEMVGEFLPLTEMTLDGLRGQGWAEPDWTAVPRTKQDALRDWDALTVRLNAEWETIDPRVFTTEHDLPWGHMSGWAATIYQIDNEIHHRGQGYVYLRELGIEPPPFWER